MAQPRRPAPPGPIPIDVGHAVPGRRRGAARARARRVPATRSAREVRLLGALLGQVIAEQAGPRPVRARRADPAAHDRPPPRRPGPSSRARRGARAARRGDRRRSTSTRLAAVAKAFTLYFQLVNLAEERQRIRVLRTRARRARGRADRRLHRRRGRPARCRPRRRGRRGAARPDVEVHPVLTAHPTEARRRTLLVALAPDPPPARPRSTTRSRRPTRTPTSGAGCARRSRCCGTPASVRSVAPTPLDEVRSELAIFDETLFVAVPRLPARDRPGARRGVHRRGRRRCGARRERRRADRDPTRSLAPALLRFGSWIGADRDGHPGVTADVTLHAARLQADHLLRGYEAVALRLMQTVAGARARRRAWTGRSTTRSSATPRSCPRRCASSAGASPRSPTASAWARSPSGSAGPGRRSPARPRRGPAATATPEALDAELAVAPGRAGRGRAGPGRVRRARRPPLAGRDVRVPPRLARGPPARRGPPGGARGARRRRGPGRRRSPAA